LLIVLIELSLSNIINTNDNNTNLIIHIGSYFVEKLKKAGNENINLTYMLAVAVLNRNEIILLLAL